MQIPDNAQAVEFLTMGGYAAYVWSAYAGTALVLALLFWASIRRLRLAERRLAEAAQAGGAAEKGV